MANVIRCRIVDDHSRYAVGLYALPELSGAKAFPFLVETFRRYGVPQAMLMDRGTLWWSAWNGWGLTRLSVRLIEQGIQLLYGRVRHPQTQGKVERFHRTLGEALRHRGVPKQFGAVGRGTGGDFGRVITNDDRTKRWG